MYGQKTTGQKATGQKTTKNANPAQKTEVWCVGVCCYNYDKKHNRHHISYDVRCVLSFLCQLNEYDDDDDIGQCENDFSHQKHTGQPISRYEVLFQEKLEQNN